MSIMAFIWNKISPGILIYIYIYVLVHEYILKMNSHEWMNVLESTYCQYLILWPRIRTCKISLIKTQWKTKQNKKTLNKHNQQHLHTQQWCHYDNRLAGPAGISGGRSVRGLYCANINDPGFETLDTDASLCEYVHEYIFMFMCTHVWSSARGWVPTAWI